MDNAFAPRLDENRLLTLMNYWLFKTRARARSQWDGTVYGTGRSRGLVRICGLTAGNDTAMVAVVMVGG